jgi:hypothetical protein
MQTPGKLSISPVPAAVRAALYAGHAVMTHELGLSSGVIEEIVVTGHKRTKSAQWGTLDNSASVEDRWNDADVYGGCEHLR